MPVRRRPRKELLKNVDVATRRHGGATVLFHQALASRIGLPPSDLRCLGLLDALGPMSPSQLAEATGLTAAAITSLIDRLEGGGYVVRERDEDDRRRLLIVPTREARERIAPHFEPMQRSWQKLLARFDDRELETIHRFLDEASTMLVEEMKRD